MNPEPADDNRGDTALPARSERSHAPQVVKALDSGWLKSSRCAGNGACVEVALAADTVGVRDGKQSGTGPVLVFTRAEWRAFLADVQAGIFDAG